MEKLSPTTFWSVVGIFVSVIGGILILGASHTSIPRHAEAADEKIVAELEVELKGVSIAVVHNKEVLVELKENVKELRVEQRQMTNEILEEIRNGR